MVARFAPPVVPGGELLWSAPAPPLPGARPSEEEMP